MRAASPVSRLRPVKPRETWGVRSLLMAATIAATATRRARKPLASTLVFAGRSNGIPSDLRALPTTTGSETDQGVDQGPTGATGTRADQASTRHQNQRSEVFKGDS